MGLKNCSQVLEIKSLATDTIWPKEQHNFKKLLSA